MIQMQCPGCGVKLKAEDDKAGRKTSCPKCGTPFTVPEPIYEAEALPGEGPDDPYALDEGDIAPMPPRGGGARGSSSSSGEDGRRPCPMCGEMIVASAAKCRYCGEVFDPALKRTEKKKKRKYADDSDMSTGDWVVALLCSGIGCLAGIIWMIQGKSKGTKMFGVSLLMVIIWNVIAAVLRAIAENPNNM